MEIYITHIYQYLVVSILLAKLIMKILALVEIYAVPTLFNSDYTRFPFSTLLFTPSSGCKYHSLSANVEDCHAVSLYFSICVFMSKLFVFRRL